MRISQIETFSTRSLCIVRVRSEDGAEGIGQTAPFHANITALVLHQQLAKHFVGQEIHDASEIGALAERAIIAEYKFPWSYICRAVAGIETALWDLFAKQAEKPVCELLGGKPRPIEVYGSSMSRTISPADEAERLSRLAAERGFGAFKIRIGARWGQDADVYPGRTEEIVATVRKALPDDVQLFVDANSAYTPKKAIEVGRMLEAHDVRHYEEPCPFPELEWTKQVADALDVPVTGGEQDNDMAQWRRMIRMRAVDVVQPDVCYIGGVARTLEVADLAHKAGLTCTPHSANRSLIPVFTAHILASIPNGGRFMEFSIEKEDGFTDQLFTRPLEIQDGVLHMSEEPGWGVTINPAWLDAAEYAVSE